MTLNYANIVQLFIEIIKYFLVKNEKYLIKAKKKYIMD